MVLPVSPLLCLLHDLFLLLGNCLLLYYLGKLRLELWRHYSVVVIELLEAPHDLLGEGFVAEVGVLLVAMHSLVTSIHIVPV